MSEPISPAFLGADVALLVRGHVLPSSARHLPVKLRLAAVLRRANAFLGRGSASLPGEIQSGTKGGDLAVVDLLRRELDLRFDALAAEIAALRHQVAHLASDGDDRVATPDA